MAETVTADAGDIRAVLTGLASLGGVLAGIAPSLPGYPEAMAAAARIAALPVTAMPEDPVASLDETAICRFELMAAHERAGFSRDEAFAMTLAVVQAAVTGTALRSARGN